MTDMQKVQQGYEAFGRGDIAASMEHFAERFDWRGLDPERPGTGHATTVAELMGEFTRMPEGYVRFEPMPERFHPLEDGVLVEGTLTIQPADSPAPTVAPFLHRYTFDDGRIVGSRFGVA
jgi:ketosteroid isomerase-like protein